MKYSDYDELTKKILEEIPDSIKSFASRDEMAKCVEEAMASAGEECGYCEKNRRE